MGERAMVELKTESEDVVALRAARGDGQALEALLERSAPTAARIAYLVLGRREDALDATQSALLQVARGLAMEWSGRGFRAWLCSCAHGAAVNLLKERLRREHREKAVAGTPKEPPMTSEQRIEKQEALTALRQELAALPQEIAAVLILHHLDGLAVAEVASQTGQSLEACKQRLHRGRETLRQRLEKRGIVLASLLMLVQLLDELCGGARAWAAEMEPSAFSALTSKALAAAAVSVVSMAAASGDPPAIDWAIDASETEKRCSETRSIERVVSMVKSPVCVFGAILMAFLALIFGVFNRSENPNPVFGVAQEGLAAPLLIPRKNSTGPKTHETTPALVSPRPHWQSPRFIKGAFIPVALSLHGQQILLLARHDVECLAVFASPDGGQTWRVQHALKGDNGDVGIDSDGNIFALSVERTKSGLCGLFWNTAKVKENLWDVPIHVWDRSFTFMRPRIFRKSAGAWIFDNGEPHKIYIGFGKQGFAPTRIALLNALLDGYHMTAWAFDEKCAGLIAYSDKCNQLVHWSTEDSGKTWQSREVSVHPESEDSQKADYLVAPLAVAQNGDDIAIACYCRKSIWDPRDNLAMPLDAAKPIYVLSSNNRGQSWRLNGPSKWLIDSSPEDVSMCYARGHLVLSYTRNPASIPHTMPGYEPIKNAWHTNYESIEGLVYSSTNAGNSWSQIHNLKAPSETSYPLIAGDSDRLFIVMHVRGTGSDENCMVVRSFAGGEWKVPDYIPSWFKEEKVPELAMEEF